jgi:uncharacterized protein (DUF983 family)
MFKKGSPLYSILTGNCPKCHEESMYVYKNPYNIGNTLKIHERCSKCQTKYRLEPSFFYGAMYVSYAVGIAFAVAAFVITNLILNTELQTTFIAIVITLIIFMPIIMRVSRNIWINMFIHFDKTALKK